jgi:transcriptional regulator with XRE-family HTH domain
VTRAPARSQRAALNDRFAENLVLLRRRAGLSQEQVAERAGLHKTQVGMLEHARRLPQLDTIVKLGGALETEPCELLAGLAWRIESDAPRQERP